MKTDSTELLEEWADRVLGQLPDYRAPATLLPGVLRAVARTASLPWHRRPWLAWPKSIQLLSVACLAGWVGLMVWLAQLGAQKAGAAELVGTVRGTGGTIWNISYTLIEALWLCVHHLPLVIFLVFAGFVAASWMGCLTLGTAFWRLAYLRRPTP